MLRSLIGPATAGALTAGALLAGCASMGGNGSAMAGYDCSRAGLQAAVNDYLAAQSAGDASLLRTADALSYMEDLEPADVSAGILTKALAIGYTNSLLDTDQCETFTEIYDPGPEEPYALGVHMTIADGAVSEIDTLVTTTGDWLFNAANMVLWAPEEDWGPVPAAEQLDRETLIFAAGAYLDRFNDEDAPVPWGYPCRRIEGGARTGTGFNPDDTCEVGVPEGVEFPIRHYVVDTAANAVTVLVPFGGEGGLPDSHTFRLEDSKLRWVHTITVCNREGMTCPQAQPAEEGPRPPNT